MGKRALWVVVLAFAAGACAPSPPPAPVVVVSAAPPDVIVKALPIASPPPPAALPKPEPPVPEPPRWTPPLDVLVRDRRPAVLSARARPLLMTEAQVLASILSSSAAVPDRAKHLRQLADVYAAIAVLSAPDKPHIVPVMRQAAIQHYDMLMQQHPGWCAAPNLADPSKSTGCPDETLYYFALENERDGNLARARAAYFRLIQGSPASSFVPAAYLAFGEMFLAESAADSSKLPLAEQSYLEVLKYPPANAVYGYAQLQLGQVYTRRNDPTRAAAALKKAVAWSHATPNAPGAAEIADAAWVALKALGVP